jgi:hypothetical protein
MIHRGGKRNLTWARMQKLADRWIPQPRVLIHTPEFALAFRPILNLQDESRAFACNP